MIHEVYTSILCGFSGQSTNDAVLAHRVIGWIAYAERPLTFDEIRHAFAFEIESDRIDPEKLSSLETLLRVCDGHVVLDDRDGAVKLFHPSAYGSFRNVTGNLETFQEDIARTCLGYLCLHEMKEGPCADIESLTTKLRQMPFLAYAAEYWGRHAERVEQQVESLIRKLLGNPILRSSWFQALQYLELKHHKLGDMSVESLPTATAPLSLATKFKNLTRTAKDILFLGGHPSSDDSQGSTPLHWACRNGYVSVLKVLLDYDADMNVKDSRGWTSLFCAISSGENKIVSLLLDKQADHLVVDIQGWTVLHWAVSTGKEEIVRTLLAYHHKFLAREKAVEVLVKDITVGQALEIKRYAGQGTDSDSIVPIKIAAREHNVGIFDVLLLDIALRNAKSAEQHSNATLPRKIFNEPLENFNSIWSSKKFEWNIGHIGYGRTEICKEERYLGPEIYLMGPLLPTNLYSSALHVAVKDEIMEAVRILLELGADVNFYNEVRIERTPLHTSAFCKDPEFARVLLQNGADPTLIDGYGQTPLHQAVVNGFKETAAVLIEHGADVNATTGAAGITPLILICGRANDQNDPLPFVQQLLACGASATLADDEGHTALHLAVELCHYGVVKELIAAGADANATDMRGNTVFHYFARGYQSSSRHYDCEDTSMEEILDLLLDHCDEGTENKISTGWGRDTHSTVSLAIEKGNWNMFNNLVERGAKLHPDAKLESLLEDAVHACQPRAVQFLLQKGAKLDLASDKTKPILVRTIEFSVRMSLDSAQKRSQTIDSFAELLQSLPVLGIDVNSVTDAPSYRLEPGATALLVAARKIDSARIIQLLIDAGADLYQVDKQGYDAFLFASICGNHESLRCLLENKAKRPSAEHWLRLPDFPHVHSLSNEALESLVCTCMQTSPVLEMRNPSGKTPLQIAIEIGNVSMVENLVAHHADIEARDSAGWSPLHTAVYEGHEAIIDVLLDAKADVSAATTVWAHGDFGRPSGLYSWSSWAGQPLHLAAMFGQETLVKKLLERGADVNASTWSDNIFPKFGNCPGHGPTALHIVLDTGKFYQKNGTESRKDLDGPRLRIAEMIIERRAVVDGVADHLGLDDVLKFVGFEELWDGLRVGISPQRGKKCSTYLFRARRTSED